jgi:hypothetical protein
MFMASIIGVLIVSICMKIVAAYQRIPLFVFEPATLCYAGIDSYLKKSMHGLKKYLM